MAGVACGTCGGKSGAYGVLVKEGEGRRPLGRPRHGCKYSIKMCIKIVAREGVEYIDLA
jgi:hypothetical protein